MNNGRTFSVCRANLCEQGRRICPTPQACQVPEADDANTPGTDPLPWLTPSRFWIGYLAGIVSALLLPHLWARF